MNEGILFVEESFIHAVAIIECFTLKEYSKSKLNDLLSQKKK
jgi:hypothetical protein